MIGDSVPAWQADDAWVIDLEPRVTIGAETGNPNDLLDGVRTAFRTASGEILIADYGSGLRAYDAQGTYARSIGNIVRSSEAGPGEYRSTVHVRAIRGDSIEVWDAALRRLSVFAPDGEFVSVTRIGQSIPPEWMPVADMRGFPSMIGTLEDGTLVAMPEPRSTNWLLSRPPGIYQDTIPVVVYDRNGMPAHRIGAFPGDEWAAHDGTASIRLFGERFLAAVGDDRIAVGTGKPFEIDVHASTGEHQGTWRIAREPEPVTSAERDRYLDHISPPGSNSRGFFEAMPFPDQVPAYSEMRFDTEGNLWVRTYEKSYEREQNASSPWPWEVFDTTGTWLGTVEVPPGMTILEFGADYVLGLVSDELDVQRVVLHTLRK